MSGSTAYVAWWDDAAGAGRVVRAAPRCLAQPALPAARAARRAPRAWRAADAARGARPAAQVSYYCEEGSTAAGGVLPTGERLADVAVNVTSAGVLSFRFTRQLAAQPGWAPPRPLGPGALSAFPLALLDAATPPSLTAALFPSWTVRRAEADSPQQGDRHFVHAGASWTRTPPFLSVEWATGEPTADSQAKIDAAAVDGPACPPIVTPAPTPAPAPAPGAAAAAPPPPGAGADSSEMGDMDMSGMAGMAGMAGMHSSFFVETTGWGSLLFSGARLDTQPAFVGALLLSALFAALTTLLAAAARPVEMRGADAGAHPAWAAAGFVRCDALCALLHVHAALTRIGRAAARRCARGRIT
jgi:hypothetical protein